jgi:hypothetical protein
VLFQEIRSSFYTSLHGPGAPLASKTRKTFLIFPIAAGIVKKFNNPGKKLTSFKNEVELSPFCSGYCRREFEVIDFKNRMSKTMTCFLFSV